MILIGFAEVFHVEKSINISQVRKEILIITTIPFLRRQYVVIIRGGTVVYGIQPIRRKQVRENKRISGFS